MKITRFLLALLVALTLSACGAETQALHGSTQPESGVLHGTVRPRALTFVATPQPLQAHMVSVATP